MACVACKLELGSSARVLVRQTTPALRCGDRPQLLERLVVSRVRVDRRDIDLLGASPAGDAHASFTAEPDNGITKVRHGGLDHHFGDLD
jgi:hypothetical protein